MVSDSSSGSTFALLFERQLPRVVRQCVREGVVSPGSAFPKSQCYIGCVSAEQGERAIGPLPPDSIQAR